ncbi:MAG TPA: hypothetical protein ENK56_02270, partial [Chloroflexi bacterium]|nr:hypothetical protein [Chloroflexota bacterium]
TQPLSSTLGQEELVFLLRLLNARPMPGLGGDPLADLTYQERALVLATAEHSLRARGLLQVGEGGKPRVDAGVVALVGGCSVPDVSFLVTCHTDGGEEEARYYHLHRASRLLVEHTFPQPGVHRFTALRDQDELAARIAEVLRLEDQSSPSCPAGRLRQDALVQAQESGEGISEIQAFLTENGLPQVTAGEMAQTLLRPLVNGSLTKFVHETDQVQGFATLEGPNGLWLLTPEGTDDTPWTSVEPMSAREVRRRIAALCEEPF